jgi:predicted nicotinamide N-methyase
MNSLSFQFFFLFASISAARSTSSLSGFIGTSSLSSKPSSLSPKKIPELFNYRTVTRSTRLETAEEEMRLHIVDGIRCREIPIDVPVVGIVTLLEATVEAQEELVDMALALDDEIEGERKLAAGDPYGAVLWPAALAVAKYLLTATFTSSKDEEPKPLQECSILELGTGTGLVSIAAALGGAKSVLATDYEPLALTLTQYAATEFHGISLPTQLLDMCDHETPLPAADLVVAADVMYAPKTGIAMAHRAVEALRRNSRVIVGDSPDRPGRPAFLKTLRELGVSSEAKFVDTIARTCSGPRHELICGKGSLSVSETPKDLVVAIMDLNPSMLK